MRISIELKGVNEALKKFDPANVLKAAKKTLKRSADHGKTIISSKIRERFNIRKSDLDDHITVNLSGLQNLQAKLIVKSRPLSLMYFDPTQNKKGGVRVRIIKKQLTILKHAWIGHGTGGTPLVLRRIPGSVSFKRSYFSKKTRKIVKREKLAAYKIITYASIIKNPFVYKSIEARIIEKMDQEWERNIKHFGEKESES